MHSVFRTRRGFSLIELLLVAAIAVVVAAIAVPKVASAGERQRAGTAAGRLVRDIASAQDRARVTATPHAVLFGGQADGVIVVSLANSVMTEVTRTALADQPYLAQLWRDSDRSELSVLITADGSLATPHALAVVAGSTAVPIRLETGAVPTAGQAVLWKSIAEGYTRVNGSRPSSAATAAQLDAAQTGLVDLTKRIDQAHADAEALGHGHD